MNGTGSFTPTSSGNFNAKNQLVIQGSDYDAAGNQKVIGGYTFVWDAEGRMVQSAGPRTTAYTYDGDGRRMMKQSSLGTTTYVYDAMGNVAAEYGGQMAAPCVTCYLSADQLGSTRAMTDGTTGQVVERYDYFPFGEDLFAGTGNRTKALGYQNASDPEDMTRRFTGKERDADTASSAMPSGLDYFGARYYSGAQGRFTSPDQPLLAQEPAHPQSWNLYSYTANNPLSRIDPDGRNWFQIGGNWEWHEGDEYTYSDSKKKQHTIHSNYTNLLVFQKTGTNKYGAATGTLTLYGNNGGFVRNNIIASDTVFSGGPNSPVHSDPIPDATFYVNSARKETATWPDAVRLLDGGASGLLHNFWGVEKIPPSLGPGFNFQTEWGSIRAALNEPQQGMPQAYRGNFLHGKTRPGDYTHGCICERSEQILNIIWTLPTPRIPVWVRGR